MGSVDGTKKQGQGTGGWVPEDGGRPAVGEHHWRLPQLETFAALNKGNVLLFFLRKENCNFLDILLCIKSSLQSN